MTTTIDVRDLPARLEEALTIVSSGHEVILTEGATPRARIIPCANQRLGTPGAQPSAIEGGSDLEPPLGLVPEAEFPIWSPYGAYDAAAALLKLLEKEKASLT